MSARALPLLFVNLGGEMVYILQQRLRAQNIDQSKAKKVLHDIVSTMFNKRFMDEIFKPQELHSKKAMRAVFDRLAHASIMRLNAASMDKLYDLMTMAVKYQTTQILRPRDLLLVTLNHLDGIRSMVSDKEDCLQTINSLYTLIIKNCNSLSDGEFQLIRQSLLAFFQDMNVRVSIFLKEKQQNQNGRFVLPAGGELPYGTQVPGTIKIYGSDGKVAQTKTFSVGSNYVPASKCGSVEMVGDRVTKLGLDMYSSYKVSETSALSSTDKKTITSSQAESSAPDPVATAQLDLLSRLIGSSTAPKTDFRLNLFNNDEEEKSYTSSIASYADDTEFLNIDASKREKNKHIEQVMGELSVTSRGDNDDDDLLDLMDAA